MTSTPASSTLRFTCWPLFCPHNDEFGSQARCSQPASQGWSFDRRAACGTFWRICKPVAYQTPGAAPGAQKKRGVALQLANFMPCSVDDAPSNCATVHARGQVLAVPVHVAFVHPPMSAMRRTGALESPGGCWAVPTLREAPRHRWPTIAVASCLVGDLLTTCAPWVAVARSPSSHRIHASDQTTNSNHAHIGRNLVRYSSWRSRQTCGKPLCLTRSRPRCQFGVSVTNPAQTASRRRRCRDYVS